VRQEGTRGKVRGRHQITSGRSPGNPDAFDNTHIRGEWTPRIAPVKNLVVACFICMRGRCADQRNCVRQRGGAEVGTSEAAVTKIEVMDSFLMAPRERSFHNYHTRGELLCSPHSTRSAVTGPVKHTPSPGIEAILVPEKPVTEQYQSIGLQDQ
jgi:hypothetical protein